MLRQRGGATRAQVGEAGEASGGCERKLREGTVPPATDRRTPGQHTTLRQHHLLQKLVGAAEPNPFDLVATSASKSELQWRRPKLAAQGWVPSGSGQPPPAAVVLSPYNLGCAAGTTSLRTANHKVRNHPRSLVHDAARHELLRVRPPAIMMAGHRRVCILHHTTLQAV